jgi:flagellar biosynthesis protein FliP
MRRLLILLALAAGLFGGPLLAGGAPAGAAALPATVSVHSATTFDSTTFDSTTFDSTTFDSTTFDSAVLPVIAPGGPARLVPKLAPTGPSAPAVPTGTVNLDVNPKPSTSVSILLLLTLLSVAPSILLLMTSFTKIFVVLGLTRNALGLNGVPPNQVLAGLSLFLSLFIMSPVVKKVNEQGVQPYLHNTKSQSVAFKDGIAPIREFMLQHTRSEEIALMLRAGHLPNPPTPDKLELTTLIPAFVLSELRSAMIIGFVVYIPFLIIDMVVSSSLMSLGMMMLPPVSVSLPFKLLLFVLVDGWGLIINALVTSYST